MSIPATWLYVATGENGVRKLGSTIDPFNRMRALREEYWQGFSLNRTWHRPLADGRLIEHIAHATLRQYRAPERPLCFELYRASLSTLYAAVERAIGKAEADDLSDLPRHSAFVRHRLPATNRASEVAKRHWARVARETEEWLVNVSAR